MKRRLWEIDFFRGIAIVLMVIFNYAFTLSYFNIYTVGGGPLFWWLFPRFVASMFIFIAGISLAVSHSRSTKLHQIMRGMKIFFLGLVITAVTWYLFPENAIYFGVLHFIGLSIILLTFFARYRTPNLILGAASIIAGFVMQNISIDSPWLLWLGLVPRNFSTFDYFPIFPWIGIMFVGLFFGNTLYVRGKRRFKMVDERNATMPLCFLGRHSLLIYLLHQVLLVGSLMIVGYRLF